MRSLSLHKDNIFAKNTLCYNSLLPVIDKGQAQALSVAIMDVIWGGAITGKEKGQAGTEPACTLCRRKMSEPDRTVEFMPVLSG